jgi:hypothetical protein
MSYNLFSSHHLQASNFEAAGVLKGKQIHINLKPNLLLSQVSEKLKEEVGRAEVNVGSTIVPTNQASQQIGDHACDAPKSLTCSNLQCIKRIHPLFHPCSLNCSCKQKVFFGLFLPGTVKRREFWENNSRLANLTQLKSTTYMTAAIFFLNSISSFYTLFCGTGFETLKTIFLHYLLTLFLV